MLARALFHALSNVADFSLSPKGELRDRCASRCRPRAHRNAWRSPGPVWKRQAF